MHLRSQFGKWGEDKAAEYLAAQGYKVVERNYRGHFGEIDIIVEKGGELTFVEVKSRKTLWFGSGAEAVTKSKQEKIHATAFEYLREHNCFGKPFWFDVIEINMLNGKFSLRHIEHCF